jgi:membrane protease YdiL (CAAX protease family)
MLLVGFLEELIFRGLLFNAMKENNLKSAIIVSSVTFGIGHFINLINGSGADLISNLCQVVSAVAFGFLFVVIFYKSKSLLPCIITHSVLNALSVFQNTAKVTQNYTIITSIILTLIAVCYCLYLSKSLSKNK